MFLNCYKSRGVTIRCVSDLLTLSLSYNYSVTALDGISCWPLLSITNHYISMQSEFKAVTWYAGVGIKLVASIR